MMGNIRSVACTVMVRNASFGASDNARPLGYKRYYGVGRGVCVRQLRFAFGMCSMLIAVGSGPALGQKISPAPSAPQMAKGEPSKPVSPVTPASSPEPAGDPASWLRLEDYPPEVRATVEQRRTVFSLSIDDRGRILQCNILESSGSPLRDSTTCGLLISNGSFKPARDAAGRAVAGTWQSGVRFSLQDPAEQSTSPQ